MAFFICAITKQNIKHFLLCFCHFCAQGPENQQLPLNPHHLLQKNKNTYTLLRYDTTGKDRINPGFHLVRQRS